MAAPATEKWVRIPTADGPMAAYLALPGKNANSASVVVFQEAFGVTDHIQDICKRLSHLGYVALAPELFHRLGEHKTFSYDTEFPKIKLALSGTTNEMLLTDSRAAWEFLAGEAGQDPARISAMGFCMGGFVTILSATALPLASAISFYGGGITQKREGIGFSPILDRFSELKCPLLCFFGDQDAGIPQEEVQRIRGSLQALVKPHEVVVYRGAGHGFFNDHRASYHPASAEAAWVKTQEWLRSRSLR